MRYFSLEMRTIFFDQLTLPLYFLTFHFKYLRLISHIEIILLAI